MSENRDSRIVIGVDVGGTYTDSVVIRYEAPDPTSGTPEDNWTILGSAKETTRRDLDESIAQSVRKALSLSKVKSEDVSAVMVGTTHFINAIVQRSTSLARVAVLRLCGPSTRAIPPWTLFPTDLREIIEGPFSYLDGGYEYDGSAISELDEKQVRSFCKTIRENKITQVVVSGVFSCVNPAQELQVEAWIKDELPDVVTTLSHTVGEMGMLERENATILNASLRPLAALTVSQLTKAFSEDLPACPFFLTANDGTTISVEFAKANPILTFASGTTNSMRGGAFLSGIKDAIVIDIGGTTTDIGILRGGFPVPAPNHVDIGGVRTNFQIPAVYSMGLGGGSFVREEKKIDIDSKSSSLSSKTISIGPKSLGYELTTKSLLFGGNILTTTDLAAAYGLPLDVIANKDLHDFSKIKSLDKELVKNGMEEIRNMIEIGIDKVRTSQEELPILLVGGGSALVDPSLPLSGARAIRPEYFAFANALGAARAQVAGVVNVVEGKANTAEERRILIAKYKEEAIEKAINLGAKPGTVEIVEISETPIAYVPNATRIKIKAIGDLSLQWLKKVRSSDKIKNETKSEPKSSDTHIKDISASTSPSSSSTGSKEDSKSIIDRIERKEGLEIVKNPDHGNRPEWNVSLEDIDYISDGAAILGAGGGGDTFVGKTICLELIRKGKKLRIIHPRDVGDTEYSISTAIMGAPTIMLEKIPSGEELIGSFKAVELAAYIKATSVSAAEIGGGNAMFALSCALLLDLPIVDIDLMGRAFPELQMISTSIGGLASIPTALADEKGNQVIVNRTATFKWLETLLRSVCVSMGCCAAICFPPITGKEIRNHTILHSYSQAWKIGHALSKARLEKKDPVLAVLNRLNEGCTDKLRACVLIEGKISDVTRGTQGGFARGSVQISGTLKENSVKTLITLEFQNEFLVAKDEHDKILATVPDIISVVESENGSCVPTEELRYGLRVSVLLIGSHPFHVTDHALKVVGPRAFHFPVDYQPVRATLPFDSLIVPE